MITLLTVYITGLLLILISAFACMHDSYYRKQYGMSSKWDVLLWIALIIVWPVTMPVSVVFFIKHRD